MKKSGGQKELNKLVEKIFPHGPDPLTQRTPQSIRPNSVQNNTINVSVSHSNATKEDIANAVEKKMMVMDEKKDLQLQAQTPSNARKQ